MTARTPGVIVIARLNAKPGCGDDLSAAAAEAARATREEPGCINYRFYQDTEEPGSFVFVEEWADDDALQSHFTQPHLAEFLGKVRDLVDGRADTLFHTVTRTRRLGRNGFEDVEAAAE